MSARPHQPSFLERNSQWALLTPALLILAVAAFGPLFIVLIYSFLTPGSYGGVVWDFSLDAWFNVFAERDIFDDTLGFADAHLAIFWRSLRLALLTTLFAFLFGFPTAYFIATRPARQRNLWMLLVMVPFWTNLLIRTFAIMELIRNEGVVNSVLLAAGLIDAPIQMLYTDFAIMLAYDLYASRLRVLRKVILPVTKPGIIAGSILVLVPSLGAYVTPRVLGGGKRMMLGNLIELQFGQGRNWPLGAALSMLLLIIVVATMVYYVRAAGREGGGHG